MFYTYVIKSKKDGKLYTGFTNNLRKRFEEHNNGRVFSTKGRGPFELIYYEACPVRNDRYRWHLISNGACVDKQDASAREKYLKSGMGKRYLKNRMKRFLSVTGFTLIELALVALIIVVLVGISTPLFRKTFSDIELDEASYNIAKFMNYAQAKAVAEIVTTKIYFDFEKNIYWLTENNDPSKPDYFTRVTGRLGRVFSTPRGIDLEGAASTLVFYPSGRSEDFKISLKNQNGRVKLVRVKEETGQANAIDTEK
ncbi:MAG: hypothetical protein COS99_06695 [Candidatus Omnitrophica bacterium CG07_land_8_20_14_0_80_42_15]|uniref:GIY-YIG domain-containing protein n=1 Tax=Candidatus Aquitaenariimonas noxiae TaxID=1974741 RepID=A0A2J0L3X0_9BACT|nr:MAG: hypothetical protein COS99_06695 [Candidatus Omnitrophica bacterium CG07_land_8_20_14_0_80_42_15]